MNHLDDKSIIIITTICQVISLRLFAENYFFLSKVNITVYVSNGLAKSQLLFMFSAMANTRLKDYKEHYDILKNVTTKWLRKNAYSEVNLTKLFDGLSVLKTEIKMES